DGFITVDLKNGGRRKDEVFWVITDKDSSSAEITEQVTIWQTAGIKYTESTDEAEKYKLGLPIHNMNDVLFSHLLQASNFGNEKINDSDGNGIMLIYAGYKEEAEMYSSSLSVKTEEPDFSRDMGLLKWHAQAQLRLGHHYMRVITGSIMDTGFYWHAENIDIAALLAFDGYHMETGKVYAIGDRNAWGRDMSQDIPHLAVRKVDGTPPTYEFGTLLPGDTFKKERIFYFNVYATDSKVRDTRYWEDLSKLM
ncbi:MAG: hypothetical protein LBK24_02460, partial [Puniceicoccales bacterium]|nr:hypothetical protein [Puniceicoccales bacterium]